MINFVKFMPLVLLFSVAHACPMDNPDCGKKDVPIHEREAAKAPESAHDVAMDLKHAEQEEEVFDEIPG